MMGNKKFKFTLTTSGIYQLKLDVNKNEKTHTFLNINVSTNISEQNVLYGSTVTVDNPTKTGYTFT